MNDNLILNEDKNTLKNVIRKILEYGEFAIIPNVVSLEDDIFFMVHASFKLSVEEYEEIIRFKEWLSNE